MHAAQALPGIASESGHTLHAVAYDRSERAARFGISATLLGVMFTAGMVTRSWKQDEISCGRPFQRYNAEEGETIARGLKTSDKEPLYPPDTDFPALVKRWEADCERTGRYAIVLIIGGAAISVVGVGSLAASGYMDQTSRR